MLSKLRRRAEEEQGFTLIELLVVILIIGILAAVAIPTFLNQRGKAYDSNAQSMVKAMQVAEETYATANNGNYTTSVSALEQIDPSIGDSTAVSSVSATQPSGDNYSVSATAKNTGDTFTLAETTAGVQSHTCTTGTGGGEPGMCVNGTW
jgi:type IV pilus assembly protein PilA